MTEPNIASLFGLRAPKPYNNKNAAPLNPPAPQLLHGVELEVENCSPEWVVAGFKDSDDGSLRPAYPQSVEFIGLPMTYSSLVHSLTTFFEKNKPTERNYSERTSIHVHTNCQDLTIQQLASLCMVYEVFERLLFRYVGHDRDKNIFCVPWHETTLSYRVISRFKEGDISAVKQWQKYTALNLIPLATQGTVEWRHMPGTANLEFIIGWLRIIGRMYAFIQKYSFDEISEKLVNLNSTSHYKQIINEVFGDDAKLLLDIPGCELSLEDGVLDMKYALMKNQPKYITSDWMQQVLRAQEMAAFERGWARQPNLANPEQPHAGVQELNTGWLPPPPPLDATDDEWERWAEERGRQEEEVR